MVARNLLRYSSLKYLVNTNVSLTRRQVNLKTLYVLLPANQSATLPIYFVTNDDVSFSNYDVWKAVTVFNQLLNTKTIFIIEIYNNIFIYSIFNRSKISF